MEADGVETCWKKIGTLVWGHMRKSGDGLSEFEAWKSLKNLECMGRLLQKLFEALFGSLPIDDIPNCTEVLDFPILILETVTRVSTCNSRNNRISSSSVKQAQRERGRRTSKHAPKHQYPRAA